MKNTLRIAALALPILLIAIAATPTYAEDRPNRNLVISFEEASGELFERGNWIRIRAGDSVFGVFYGTETARGPIRIFAEQTRYLGVAEIFDAEGNFIARRPVPVRTFFGQTLDRLIEFVDVDGNNRVDFRVIEEDHVLSDIPVKTISMSRAWTYSVLAKEGPSDGTFSIDFALTATNILYDKVWVSDTMQFREGTVDDGMLEELSIIFHVRVTSETVQIERIPLYRVTADREEREIIDAQKVGALNFTGTALTTSFKYDHSINGWDFAPDIRSKLAMRTEAFAANAIPIAVAEEIHDRYSDMHASTDDGKVDVHDAEVNGDHTEFPTPTLVVRNRIVFDDEWFRIGELTWVSDVTVDGEPKAMFFQLHFAERFVHARENRVFVGFRIVGAFVYPHGSSSNSMIFHDPELVTSAMMLDVPTVVNLLPVGTFLLQGLVLGGGVAAAVGLAFMARRRNPSMGPVPSTGGMVSLPG